MFANNQISTIVESQLPDFIRADHPKFVTLLKKYYEYMEQSNKTLDVGKKLYDFMDVDTTRTDLIKYIKSKFIPNFPDQTELSAEKIIKASREFYAIKGTPDSFKFLFRVLYNQEVEVYFPKQDVLKASDGKWKLPQALRLAFNDTLTLVEGGNVNVFAVSANTVTSNGVNLVSANITSNSFIQIGNQKRLVQNVNAQGLSLTVTIPFANVYNTVLESYETQTFDSAKLYKVTPSDYSGFDINLLERRKGVGEHSRTSCIIEKAVRSIDKETGREIIELYVSNVTRLFDAGEYILIDYVDENGDTQTFRSKIISLISNVRLYRNRLGVVQTGRRYKVGDPVIFDGGLADTPEAEKAIAVVNNVSTGTIDSVSVTGKGYYFRAYSNSLIRVISNTGIGANVVIDRIWEDSPANANTFAYCTDAIVYKRDIQLNDPDGYDFDNVPGVVRLTTGSGNSTTTVNLNTATHLASSVDDYYNSYVLQIVGGTGVGASPNRATITDYNGTTKVATLGTALGTAPDATSNVQIFVDANTQIGRAFSYENILLGAIRNVFLEDGGSFFEEPPSFETISVFDTDYSIDEGFMSIPAGQFSGYNKNGIPYPSIRLSSSNSSYSLANGFYTGCRLFLDVGQTEHYANVVDYVVTNPGTSANVKTVYLDRKFENNINPTNILRFRLFMDFRQNVRNVGKIAVVLVKKGGEGYSSSDMVEFVGTGYGGTATITTGANGTITAFNLSNGGEGYVEMPTVRIWNSTGTALSAGSNAEFEVIGFSDGETLTAETTDIGRIQDFRIISRGFDYESTPNVSLKIVDVLTDNLPASAIVGTGDRAWQGNVASNANATFSAIVDASHRPDSTNSVIRLYNYNGTLNTALPLNLNTAIGNLTVNVSTQNAIISFQDIYDATERTYPHFYGDGRAKANAEFLNGLIKYNGFFLNTDGFISADKKLQDRDFYHNYSYEIQSESSLHDYKETLFRLAHPAGMHLRSKYVIKDVESDVITIKSNTFIQSATGTTNLNTSFSSNVVYGNSSAFLSNVNVGDMIIINTTETASGKQYTRVVTNVVSNDIIWLESPIGGLGDGRLRIVSGNSNVFVYGNLSAVSESLEVGDNITFNISGTEYRKEILGVSGNVIQLNTSTGHANANILYRKTPVYNAVAYKIIRTNG
jgi:hypothetical protein